jgi:diguanylate cyclase (GGDEF)-like protein
VIGEINVWANSALISNRATRIVLNDITLLIVLTLLLAAASMLATNILVTTPLRRLADQVTLAKPGEQGLIGVEKIHENDEIGLVTDSVNGFLSVTRIALEKERELRLQIEQMNQHFSSVFASSHVGIMVVDRKGKLLHHNPVLFESIIKLDESQHNALLHEDIFSMAFADSHEVWALIETARTTQETVESDLPLTAAWRQPFWVHCILTVNRDERSDEEIIECVLYDVTRRIQEADAAMQLASQDSLTGLHNRRGCERYLQQWLNESKEKDHLVVMLLDLDSFKPVNDQFGHGAGDLVLQTIATRLQNEVRANMDLIGRIGGDEFVVFLKMKSDRRDLVEQVAQKILRNVAAPILLSTGQTVEVGVSIGIAFASNFNSLDDLMQAADEAMYQVKIKGKNDFIFAS